ncbi:MAG: hypothetical protein AAB599_01710 [Patescibacteria group bacterium]
MTDIDKWMAERAKKDKVLYEKYGRPLEKKHKGKIVAIGENDLEVAQEAIKKFGSGNFAFKRIGYPYFVLEHGIRFDSTNRSWKAKFWQ